MCALLAPALLLEALVGVSRAPGAIAEGDTRPSNPLTTGIAMMDLIRLVSTAWSAQTMSLSSSACVATGKAAEANETARNTFITRREVALFSATSQAKGRHGALGPLRALVRPLALDVVGRAARLCLTCAISPSVFLNPLKTKPY